MWITPPRRRVCHAGAARDDVVHSAGTGWDVLCRAAGAGLLHSAAVLEGRHSASDSTL